MSGYKHHSQIIKNETVKGYFSPDYVRISFAVPNDKILRQFVMYDTCGKHKDCSWIKSLEGKSCCLTFDGKKLKLGLTENAGDMDLLGFGQGTTLNE
ncbi:hypothetical protein MAR_022875 [Mya arenaria]|uniref:Uncharacterized protein n=1 Tax=Mya arenaria TaxID=6604 RepID=A0ABY7DLB5_MYAAR|nr:hypothetical protein MAR_022875 [Mya arenaria]